MAMLTREAWHICTPLPYPQTPIPTSCSVANSSIDIHIGTRVDNSFRSCCQRCSSDSYISAFRSASLQSAGTSSPNCVGVHYYCFGDARSCQSIFRGATWAVIERVDRAVGDNNRTTRPSTDMLGYKYRPCKVAILNVSP